MENSASEQKLSSEKSHKAKQEKRESSRRICNTYLKGATKVCLYTHDHDNYFAHRYKK